MGKNKKDLLIGTLAVLITLALIAEVGALMFVEIKTANKDLVNVGVMATISLATIVYSYFFGSSRSSAKKDETIAQMTATASDEPPKLPGS